MKLREPLNTLLDHFPYSGKSRHTLELSTADEGKVTLPETTVNKKVGGTALVDYVNKQDFLPEEKEQTENFNHLFPITYLLEKGHGEHVSMEEAEKLATELDPDNPYHDFAIGELALYRLAKGDVEYAYHSLEALGTSSLAVHVLSHIVMYEDEQQKKTLDYAAISEQLHDLAIASYNEADDTLSATALIEASEALYDDDDLRAQARKAIREHPEVPQAAPVGPQDIDVL